MLEIHTHTTHFFHFLLSKDGGKLEKGNRLFPIFRRFFLNQLILSAFISISFVILRKISGMFLFGIRDQGFHTQRLAVFRTYHIYYRCQRADGLFAVRLSLISKVTAVDGMYDRSDILLRISPIFKNSGWLQLSFPNQLTDDSFFWSISFNSCSLSTSICAFTSLSSFFNKQNNSSLHEFSIKKLF